MLNCYDTTVSGYKQPPSHSGSEARELGKDPSLLCLRPALSVFTFLRSSPVGDTTKCPSPKNRKNWGFSPPEGDRINRSRHLVDKRRPGPALAHQIWPSVICKGDGLQKPPKCENLVEIAIFRQFFCFASVTQYSNLDEINPISIDHWLTVACQIWPDRECAHAAGFAVAAAWRCLQFLQVMWHDASRSQWQE